MRLLAFLAPTSLVAFAGPARAQTHVEIRTPMSPPAWALLERELLRANSRAVEAFYGNYASVLAYANRQDRSLAIVPEVSAQIQHRVTVYARASFFSGAADTEFGNVPLAYSASLGFRVAF